MAGSSNKMRDLILTRDGMIYHFQPYISIAIPKIARKG